MDSPADFLNNDLQNKVTLSMTEDGIEDPEYHTSLRTRRIFRTIATQSLTSHFKLSFLVFGPGRRSEEFHSHRVPVKRRIEKLNQTAALPEEISLPSRGTPLEKALVDNPAAQELFLMKEYDYTVILLMSRGSISEYSLYLTKSEVAHKIRLFIPAKDRNAQSYLMTGPVKVFNDVYRQVYYFKDPQHLLKKVEDMVIKMIVLKAFQS